LLKGLGTEEEPNVIFGRAENVDVNYVTTVFVPACPISGWPEIGTCQIKGCPAWSVALATR
jgi:hypothetical protein